MRFALGLVVCSCLFSASGARALEGTKPHVRIGAVAGLLGTLPVGSNSNPEFNPALWVHVDAIAVDIGDYFQLNTFFRLKVAGGYDVGPLRDSLIQPAEGQIPRATISSRSREALMGLSGKLFPFGATKVRPFLSLGAGFATSGATGSGLTAAGQRQLAQELAMGQSPNVTPVSINYRHRGVGLIFGAGVRFDPTIPAFGEKWVLPITVELAYMKNIWLNLERSPKYIWQDGLDPTQLPSQSPAPDPAIQPSLAGLGHKHMHVDFLGVLVTFGFLR